MALVLMIFRNLPEQAPSRSEIAGPAGTVGTNPGLWPSAPGGARGQVEPESLAGLMRRPVERYSGAALHGAQGAQPAGPCAQEAQGLPNTRLLNH